VECGETRRNVDLDADERGLDTDEGSGHDLGHHEQIVRSADGARQCRGSHTASEIDLRYMNTQGDAILVNGYGTNWNLTALKIWMLEQNAAGVRDVEFAKDADWLVSNLLDPQWIVSVRVE